MSRKIETLRELIAKRAAQELTFEEAQQMEQLSRDTRIPVAKPVLGANQFQGDNSGGGMDIAIDGQPGHCNKEISDLKDQLASLVKERDTLALAKAKLEGELKSSQDQVQDLKEQLEKSATVYRQGYRDGMKDMQGCVNR